MSWHRVWQLVRCLNVSHARYSFLAGFHYTITSTVDCTVDSRKDRLSFRWFSIHLESRRHGQIWSASTNSRDARNAIEFDPPVLDLRRVGIAKSINRRRYVVTGLTTTGSSLSQRSWMYLPLYLMTNYFADSHYFVSRLYILYCGRLAIVSSCWFTSRLNRVASEPWSNLIYQY